MAYNENELMNKPDYWMEKIQNELSREITEYLKKNNVMTLSIISGLSLHTIGDIIRGASDIKLSQIITLALALNKIPEIIFKSLQNEI